MEWYLLIVFLFVIIIRELGHAIGFSIFAKKFPDIRTTWFGCIFVGEKLQKELSLIQLSIVALLGIATGLLYFNLIKMDSVYMLIYIIMCVFDFNVLLILYAAEDTFRFIKMKYLKTVDIRNIKVIN